MFFGERRGANIIDKIQALQTNPPAKLALDHLYQLLTILDTKATGLLTVDALFIAILSVMLAPPDVLKPSMGHNVHASIIEIQLGVAVVSAFLCMLVMRISWSFLYWVTVVPSQATDFDLEIASLANVLDDRTHCYWLAWVLALFAFVLTLAWWSWAFALGAGLALALWLWAWKRC